MSKQKRRIRVRMQKNPGLSYRAAKDRRTTPKQVKEPSANGVEPKAADGSLRPVFEVDREVAGPSDPQQKPAAQFKTLRDLIEDGPIGKLKKQEQGLRDIFDPPWQREMRAVQDVLDPPWQREMRKMQDFLNPPFAREMRKTQDPMKPMLPAIAGAESKLHAVAAIEEKLGRSKLGKFAGASDAVTGALNAVESLKKNNLANVAHALAPKTSPASEAINSVVNKHRMSPEFANDRHPSGLEKFFATNPGIGGFEKDRMGSGLERMMRSLQSAVGDPTDPVPSHHESKDDDSNGGRQ